MGSGLTVAKDGKIYFANISSENTTSSKYLNKLFLELKPTGGVYCYDPQTKTTRTIMMAGTSIMAIKATKWPCIGRPFISR
jgi:sugar lactone lactonase YvrE